MIRIQTTDPQSHTKLTKLLEDNGYEVSQPTSYSNTCYPVMCDADKALTTYTSYLSPSPQSKTPISNPQSEGVKRGGKEVGVFTPYDEAIKAQDIYHACIHSNLTCYQCDKKTTWLAPDSRCGDCTRYTPSELI